MSHELETTISAFYRHEESKANEVFLRQPFGKDWKEYTWGQVGEQVRKMATYLKANLPEKSKVGILSLNCSHWFMADLAIMMAGHISVPIYPTAGKNTIATILEHSEAEMLFVGKLWDWAAKKEAIPKELKKIGFFHEYPDFESWDQIIASNEAMTDKPDRDLDEIASIIYTSGTTGMPKGVMIDFRALANAANAGIEYVQMQQESFFSYLPLAHCAERELVEIISIHSGSVVSFTESLDTFQQNILSVRPSIFLGVPRIWLKFQQGIESKVGKSKLALLLKLPVIKNIIRKKIVAGLGLNNVKVALSGAAALPEATIKFFEKLGINICEAYGLTESMAFGTANIPNIRQSGSVGKAVISSEVVIDEESGEVLLKSPSIMQGYYKEPLKTAEVMTSEGYLKTGDLGTVDENGFLFITGRVKDIFKTSKGKYVSPIPIESKLEPELGVENLCVIGDGLPAPVAVASVFGKEFKDKNAYLKEAEVIFQKLNGGLEKHERISHILLVNDEWNPDNGLITPTLKIRRPQLEEKYMPLIEKHRKSDNKVIWA